MCTMADGAVDSVSLSHVPCISILPFTRQYPTPSINPHTSICNPHISILTATSRAHFSISYLSHHFRFFQQRRMMRFTRSRPMLVLRIGASSFPSNICLPVGFSFQPLILVYLFSLRPVRPYSYRACRLLHFLYNVYLFLDVRYALFFFATPSPFPSFFDRFSSPLTLLISLSRHPPTVKSGAFSLAKGFLCVPFFSGGSDGRSSLDHSTKVR